MTIRTWWARLKERFWDKEIEEIEHPQVAGFFVRTPPLRSAWESTAKLLQRCRRFWPDVLVGVLSGIFTTLLLRWAGL